MKTYNGHRSWNAWNVSLWIDNDEYLYNLALDCVEKSKCLNGATRKFLKHAPSKYTPDGARYNFLVVKLTLKNFWDEQQSINDTNNI